MSALRLRCGIAWSTRRVHGPTRGRTVIDAFQSARAFVALGSNLGNRAANMEAAVERLRKLPHTHVVATSHVYETLPRINDETNHVQDAMQRLSVRPLRGVIRTSHPHEISPKAMSAQPMYLNAAVELKTSLSPHDLLQHMQRIERELGRRPGPKYSPREIDLDLLLHGDVIIYDAKLTLPHPELHKRGFVLEPLADLDAKIRHPILKRTISELASEIRGCMPREGSQGPNRHSDRRVLPISSKTKNHAFAHQGRTRVFGILNMTPDSFYDDQLYMWHHISQKWMGVGKEIIVDHAAAMVNDGADVIDIGGQSTRPGATMVSSDEEEMDRVVPIIQALRSNTAFDNVPISIDTVSSRVAIEAVRAGANMINDVSSGFYDTNMLKTAALAGVPYIVTHRRGPGGASLGARSDFSVYEDVVREVRAELQERVVAAEAAGVMRWNIVADPGIGFEKQSHHDIQLLQRFAEAVPCDLPSICGPSRKSFLAAALSPTDDASDPDFGPQSEQRLWGTAAAVSAAVNGGAMAVRVHDVKEMTSVCRVCDAISKPNAESTDE